MDNNHSKPRGAKLLTYDIKIPSKVSSNTRGFNFKDKKALNCVVVNLLTTIRKEQALCYSRDNSIPSVGKKKLNPRRIIKAVDFLEAEGYIINIVGKGHILKEKRIMSEMKPTPKFRSFVGAGMEVTEQELKDIEDGKYTWTDSVEIRKREKKALSRYESVKMDEIKKSVVALNILNNNSVIVYGGGVVLENECCRIFNRDLEHGGRWYKVDILGIKNRDTKERLDVKIDGESVVEVDYRSLHFRIASTMEGIGVDELPDDVYGFILGNDDDYTDVDHRMIKTSVILMFNCHSEEQAARAINKLVRDLPDEDRLQYNLGNGRAVMSAVFEAVPYISTKMCGGIEDYGLKLQNADSHLADDIIKVFVQKEIPILPVHDSFIVKYKDLNILIDTMGNKFRERFDVDYLIPLRLQYKLNGEIVTDDLLA